MLPAKLNAQRFNTVLYSTVLYCKLPRARHTLEGHGHVQAELH